MSDISARLAAIFAEDDIKIRVVPISAPSLGPRETKCWETWENILREGGDDAVRLVATYLTQTRNNQNQLSSDVVKGLWRFVSTHPGMADASLVFEALDEMDIAATRRFLAANRGGTPLPFGMNTAFFAGIAPRFGVVAPQLDLPLTGAAE